MKITPTTKEQKEQIYSHTLYLNEILCSCPDFQVREDGIGGFTVSYNYPYLKQKKVLKMKFITVFVCLLADPEHVIPFIFCNDCQFRFTFAFAKNLYANDLDVKAELIKFLKENLD